MADARRILVTGSTGLVGRRLVDALRDDGLAIGAVTRRPERARFDDGVEAVGWNGVEVAPEELAKSSAVVHLAGEPVFGGAFSAERRRRILESRVDSTRALVRAIGELAPDERPRTFVCASAVGYYGSQDDRWLTETSPADEDFLGRLAVDWEAAAAPAAEAGIRVVHPRLGLVLSPAGGALGKMLLPFRAGLGGVMGPGTQYLSWVAMDDVLGAFHHAMVEEGVEGPFNLAAPEPVTNRELTKTLGRVLGRPTVTPAPAFALRLALGEMADATLLASTRVRPAVLLETGYAFRFPTLEGALRHLLGKVRE